MAIAEAVGEVPGRNGAFSRGMPVNPWPGRELVAGKILQILPLHNSDFLPVAFIGQMQVKVKDQGRIPVYEFQIRQSPGHRERGTGWSADLMGQMENMKHTEWLNTEKLDEHTKDQSHLFHNFSNYFALFIYVSRLTKPFVLNGHYLTRHNA